jgi:hypothetical protein
MSDKKELKTTVDFIEQISGRTFYSWQKRILSEVIKWKTTGEKIRIK